MLSPEDGGAMACGSYAEGRCDLPAPVADLSYAQAPAGVRHTVLLGSGGGAVACGMNEEGQRGLGGADRPPELRAGCRRRAPHSAVLPGSGGGAVACGLSEGGQRDLLAPSADLSHAQAAAGGAPHSAAQERRRRRGLWLERRGSV